ncbi:MAG TPA: hypothetical protein GX501_00890 [Clostridiaceae bacterium]|nr:hypothetical protein [Clostridiaceae bacterium]
MDRNNYIKKVRTFLSNALKKLSDLNKGSRILLWIGKAVFFAFLLAALVLTIMFMMDPAFLDGKTILVEWIVLYSFRFWVITFVGALILDILINR